MEWHVTAGNKLVTAGTHGQDSKTLVVFSNIEKKAVLGYLEQKG